MTLTEWILFIAVIDGPVFGLLYVIDGPLIGLLYLIWKRVKRLKDESK